MPSPSTEVEVASGLTYQERETGPLQLDVVAPQGATSAPVVVFIHGGGWLKGNREHFQQQARALARRGIAGVLIEYRLSDVATYPAAPRDVAAAVEWTRSNAESYGIDSDRLALAGGSAGGHLAALVGLAPDCFEVEGPIKAIAGFNGVYDLRDDALVDTGMVRDFLGVHYDEAPDRYEEASPITHVDSSDPPTLALHGTEDGTVPYAQAKAFQSRLSEVGVPAELATAKGAGHGYFNNEPWYTRTLVRLWSFFDDHI